MCFSQIILKIVMLFRQSAVSLKHLLFSHSCLVIGSEFMKYMEAFKPILMMSLKNTAEYQVKGQSYHVIDAKLHMHSS